MASALAMDRSAGLGSAAKAAVTASKMANPILIWFSPGKKGRPGALSRPAAALHDGADSVRQVHAAVLSRTGMRAIAPAIGRRQEGERARYGRSGPVHPVPDRRAV